MAWAFRTSSKLIFVLSIEAAAFMDAMSYPDRISVPY